MDGFIKQLPPGIQLSPVAHSVFEILLRYTAFPWPVLAAQCKRAGCVPEKLTLVDLRGLIPALSNSVGRFTSPEKEQAARSELTALLLQPELRAQARKPG
jgi:hypothetical protein